jgi:hypothetical protein
VSVPRAVWLYIGDGREGSVHEIGEQISHAPHVIRNHARVVGLPFKWVADIAVAPVEWAGRTTGVEAATVIFPRNIVGTKALCTVP